MALYKDQHIPELFEMKHRNDDFVSGYDFQDTILTNSLSSYSMYNENTNGFITKLQKIIYHFFDQFNIMRNFKNWNVDKYYNKHTK